MRADSNRGVTARIPYCYSEELSELVKQMLKVNPRHRPSSAQIVQIINRLKKDPTLIKKLSEEEKNRFILNEMEASDNGELIGTI